MRRLIFAAFVFLIVAPAHAFAQQSAYQFKVPDGWTSDFQGTMAHIAPKDDPRAALIQLLHVQKPQGNLQRQAEEGFAAWQQAFTALGAASNPKPGPKQHGTANGSEFVVISANFTSMEGKTLTLTLRMREEKGAVGIMLFTAWSEEAAKRYNPAAEAMFESLHLTDEAAKVAIPYPPADKR